VFFTRQGLLALKPSNGEIRYQHPWRPRLNASVNAATPIVSGDRIYLSTSYGTGAIVLEAKKGKVESIWEGDKSISNHYNTPVLIKGFLYGVDGRQEGGRASLRCVEWDTGKVRWTKEAFGCAALVYADGLLVATRENGHITLIEPSTEEYKELADAEVLDSPVRALPALANGWLFVRDGKKLVALEVRKK
jgi:outer membrane protein assembly factor BamB